MTMLIAAMTARCMYVRGLRGSGSRATTTTVASSASPMSSRVAMSVNVGRVSTPSLMKA